MYSVGVSDGFFACIIYRVIVEATPGINVDTIAMATQEQADSVQGDCSSEDDFELPPVNFDLFAERGFEIDWCTFQVGDYISARIHLRWFS